MAFDVEAPCRSSTRLRVAALAALVAGASSACRSHASADDCRGVTEHYLDLATSETPGAASLSPAQVAAVRDVERGLKRAEPSFRAVEDRCEGVTRAEVSCAIDSTSTKAWEACFPDAGR